MSPDPSSSPAVGRLLLVTPDFPPHLLGGGGVVCERLTEEYRGQGWQVDVISMDTSRAGIWSRAETLPPAGGTVTFLPLSARMQIRQGSLLLSIPPSLPGLFRLVREFRRHRWQAVHLHGNPSVLVDLAALLCRLRRQRFVITFHGILQDARSLGGVGSRMYRLLSAAERRIFSSATAVTAVSASTLREVQKAGFRCPNMLVIPNASPDRRGVTDPSGAGGEAELARLGLRRGDFVLCLAAYTPRKGQGLALEAFYRLLQRPNVPKALSLVFAGYERDPEFVAALRRQTEEMGLLGRVRFFGPVSEESKRTLLSSARWVLLPSTYEASPILAFEALDAGCVLIASDLEAVREVAGSEGSAVTFRPGDAPSLQGAMESLLAHPERETQIRAAARERARSFLTWREVATQYLAALEATPPGIRPPPGTTAHPIA